MRISFAVQAVFVVALITGSSLYAQASRGISIAPVRIPDESGKQVELYQESYALVIGVSSYTAGWPSLPGVMEDVHRVQESLQRQGFQVETVLDPNRVQLDEAFNSFISRHGRVPENRLLFFFAGHGHTLRLGYGEEMGYIVPADAPNPNRDPDAFKDKAMDMQQIEVYARKIESKHALFLFDCCFSGSIFALSRAIPENINYKTSQPVRQFITSGGADEKVPDKSVFCDQFLEALDGEGDRNGDGFVTGSELGEFLLEKVVNYSRGAQHPQYGKIRNPNLDKGDFVFSIAPAPAKSPGESPLPEPRSAPAPAPSTAPVEQRPVSLETSKPVQGVDWQKRMIIATGFGAPNKNFPSERWRFSAIEAARIHALAKLLEETQGICVTSTETVENFTLKDQTIKTRVEGIVKNFQVLETRDLPGGAVEVDVALPIDGNLSSLFIPEKQADLPPLKIPKGEKTPKKDLIYTGLIVDARGLEARPAMVPRIINEEGKEVYGAGYVSRADAIAKGIVGYSKDLEKAGKDERVKDNPVTVKGLRASGSRNTDIVISNDDAYMLHSSPDNLKFMQQCKVLIILD